MGIKFDAAGCINALTEVLTKALLELRQEFKDYVISEYSKSGLPQVDLEEGVVKQLAGYISAEIVGGPWSVLAEWGRGSLLDPSNPALAEYMRSDRWNPLRGSDFAIVGREKGYYKNFFGETVYSSGGLAGRNLEDKYPPTSPTHGMRVTAKWILSEARPQKVIKRALQTFPWGKFLIATKD